MIKLFVRRGLLGDEVQQAEIEPGITPATLLTELRSALPASLDVMVGVDGRLLDESDSALHVPLVDGQQVIVMPRTSYGYGEAIVSILIQIAIAAVISYVAYLLTPRPRPPGVPQDRGDDGSSAYAWDGIKTNYGPGLPVPFVYGHHAVGGQVIWTDTEAVALGGAGAGASVDDKLRLILSLSEGPVHSVGGIAADANGLGGATAVPGPVGIYVNGNQLPTVGAQSWRGWTRLGTYDQAALPPPLSGVSTAYSPQLQFRTFQEEAIFTVPDPPDDLRLLRFVMAWPAGLYEQTSQGGLQGVSVRFLLFWRYADDSGSPLQVVTGALANLLSPSGGQVASAAFPGYHVLTASIPCNQSAGASLSIQSGRPVEFRLRYERIGGGGAPVNTGTVIQAVWRDLVLVGANQLRYPLEALLGLEMKAGPLFSGGKPQVQVPVKGALVRLWDATLGWSPRCWERPASPWDFQTYAPGRNPAWVLLDFLTARWGLGRYLTEDQIDLPAFRRWAAFCDSDPNPADPWGEPSHTVDLVGDQPRPAWEWVLQICAAGRASPVLSGGRISVVYQYRDAHGDAGVSVPAKTPVQLLTDGNCQEVKVTWLSKANRATVYDMQFLDETQNWAQAVLPVEDEDGTLNSPSAQDQDRYLKEAIQAFGVTRPSQIYREGRYRHRINRLVRREIAGVTGPWALAAQVGDLIEFQTQFLRPFEEVATAMQVLAVDALADPPTLTIDHTLSGTGLQVVVRMPDGTPARANILTFLNTTLGGRPVCVLSLAAALSPDVGAAAVVGKVSSLTEVYQLISITMAKGLRREFRAVQWTPEAYDPITLDEFEGTAVLDGDMRAIDAAGDESAPEPVLGVTVLAQGGGSHRISWGVGSDSGLPSRVFVRVVGGTDWQLIGTSSDASLNYQGFSVGVRYDVSVVRANRRGQYVQPDAGAVVQVTPEEFSVDSPMPITSARATVVDDEVLLEWDENGQSTLDYVEVRAGSQWAAAPVLARSRAARLPLENPPGGVPLLLAARSRNGLYGDVVALPAVSWTPPGRVQRLLEDDLAPSPAGTHTNTQWNATTLRLELAPGALLGTYESLAQDMGFDADFYWQVRVDPLEWDDTPVSELDFIMGSGEARWRRVSGRPASPSGPGLDWRLRVADLAMPVRDLPANLTSRGYLGVFGSHTQVLVESRFHVNGSWTAYRPHVDRVLVARQMQVRLTLGRRSQTYRAEVRALAYAAFL